MKKFLILAIIGRGVLTASTSHISMQLNGKSRVIHTVPSNAIQLLSASITIKTPVILKSDNAIVLTAFNKNFQIPTSLVTVSSTIGDLSCFPYKEICLVCGIGGCVAWSLKNDDFYFLGHFYHKKYSHTVNSVNYKDYVYKVETLKYTNFFFTVENMSGGGGGLIRWDVTTRNCYERFSESKSRTVVNHNYFIRRMQYTRFIGLSIVDNGDILFFLATDLSEPLRSFNSAVGGVKGVGPFDFLTFEPHKNHIYTCNIGNQCALVDFNANKVLLKHDFRVEFYSDTKIDIRYYDLRQIPQLNFVFITYGKYLLVKVPTDDFTPANYFEAVHEYHLDYMNANNDDFIKQVLADHHFNGFYALTNKDLKSFEIQFKYTPGTNVGEADHIYTVTFGADTKSVKNSRSLCHVNCKDFLTTGSCNGIGYDASKCVECQDGRVTSESLKCAHIYTRGVQDQPFQGYVTKNDDYGIFTYFDYQCINQTTATPSTTVTTGFLNSNGLIGLLIFGSITLLLFGLCICLFKDQSGPKRYHNPYAYQLKAINGNDQSITRNGYMENESHLTNLKRLG